MVWTKNKPTLPGFYWLRNLDTPFTKQPPRVVRVGVVDEDEPEDELFVHEGPTFDQGEFLLKDLTENHEWSSDSISEPVEVGSCGCADVEDGHAACHACAPPKRKSLGTMYLARRGCGKVSAVSWDGPDWTEEDKRRTLAEWEGRGDTVEKVERFEGDPQPEWICGSENCRGDCIEPKELPKPGMEVTG